MTNEQRAREWIMLYNATWAGNEPILMRTADGGGGPHDSLTALLNEVAAEARAEQRTSDATTLAMSDWHELLKAGAVIFDAGKGRYVAA